MPRKTDRTGEKRIMNNGMEAVVIAYYSFANMTVLFSDGTQREHICWRDFNNGRVAHISDLPSEQAKARVGQKHIMKNGMEATITAYYNSRNIDVVFADGTEVKGCSYSEFTNGVIANPNVRFKVGISLQEYAIQHYLYPLGFRKIKTGEWKSKGLENYELDFFHPDANIAIEYDGNIHKFDACLKRDIHKNELCRNLGIQLYRIREEKCPSTNNLAKEYFVTRKQQVYIGLFDCKNELEEILHSHNIFFPENHIDFERDKDIIVDSYNSQYMNYYAKYRVGEKSFSKTFQQELTLIAYHASDNVDVQFADGAIKYGTSYQAFRQGKVQHPTIPINYRIANTRVGETRMMSCGLRATIIQYFNSDNSTVQFEDGAIRENVTYDYFQKGKVEHPDINTKIVMNAAKLIGQTHMMNCGLEATIAAYRSSEDMDVIFANGIKRCHVTYANFRKGKVSPVARRTKKELERQAA